MLLKVLFLLLILYLALRAIRNLFRAIWAEPRDPGRLGNVPPRETSRTYHAPPAHAARKTYDVEVEDARWVDVERSERR